MRTRMNIVELQCPQVTTQPPTGCVRSPSRSSIDGGARRSSCGFVCGEGVFGGFGWRSVAGVCIAPLRCLRHLRSSPQWRPLRDQWRSSRSCCCPRSTPASTPTPLPTGACSSSSTTSLSSPRTPPTSAPSRVCPASHLHFFVLVFSDLRVFASLHRFSCLAAPITSSNVGI